jgi:hypothetical protein
MRDGLQEEGEYEYVSDHQHFENGNEVHRLGSGVLYQPLGGDSASNGTTGFPIPLCEATAQSPCARSVPDDHSPNVQSEFNRTGQHCSGHRGGGRGGGGGRGAECHTAAAVSTAPGMFSGPPGWFAILAGQLICFILGT